MGILPKYSSSFLVEGADLPNLRADILQRLDARLGDLNAGHLDLKPGSLTFSGGIFRSLCNWHVLTNIRRGEIRIVESDRCLRVTYEISWTRAALVTWLPIPFLCSLIARHWMIFLVAVSAFTLYWILLVCLVFLTTVLRFRGIITRAVLDAGGRVCDR